MISREQYAALRQGAGLVDRSDRGRIRLSGRDRRDYLQGLLSNDTAALTPGTGCYACLLTAQGRMISDMYVIETGEVVLLDLERAVTGRVAAQLDQFVFSEDVVVTDVSDATGQLGVFGPASADVVRRLSPARTVDLEELRVLDNRATTWQGEPVTIVRRDDLGGLGFDLLIAAARTGDLSRALVEAGAVAVGGDVVEVCRVEAGRPVFGKDMAEDTIPIEAGIEDRAISRTKGCYVGQEVVVRVLDRGHGRVARRLAGLTCDAAAEVAIPGSPIASGDRSIGAVTSAVWSPSLERPIALGYVHRDFVEPGTAVTIGSGVGAVVTALPFVQF
jgi:folate-binding protein YgfZ